MPGKDQTMFTVTFKSYHSERLNALYEYQQGFSIMRPHQDSFGRMNCMDI